MARTDVVGRSARITWLAAIVGCVAAAGALANAQAPASPSVTAAKATPASTVAESRGILDSVVFIGASATAGFGVIIPDPEGGKQSFPLPLSAGFEGVVTNFTADTPIRNVGSSFFFMSPGVTGTAQVDRALEAQPTLVVGVDFLFWYGYGNDDGKGGKLTSEAGRLEKLKLGFKELERLGASVPIVVGDFPDMSAAVGGMLSLQQMPALETLTQLNAALKEWCAVHPNVILFPLSDLVGKLKSGDPITIANVEFTREKGRLLQSDNLHPTARGSIAMGLRVAELVRERMASSAAAHGLIETAGDELLAKKRAHAAAKRALEARSGGAAKTTASPKSEAGKSSNDKSTERPNQKPNEKPNETQAEKPAGTSA
jgi:hypothetical protein